MIRREILALAKRDAKFLEVAARPSLLYSVAVLWHSAGLGQRENINSALVIDLFIRQMLQLSSLDIEKTVGKGMVGLLESLEQQRSRSE